MEEMEEIGIVAKNSPYILGIDLGTTNSAIAIFVKGQPEVIKVNDEKMCPSVFSVRRDGEILVGQAARNRTSIDPENTISSIKREMGGDWKKVFSPLPGQEFTPEMISAEILSKLVSAAEQNKTIDLRGNPTYAVICIPANFNDLQKQATREAGKLANLEVLYLLEEPVAAAIAYAVETKRDQTILVYDLGGGTFDVSILEVDSTQEGSSAKFKLRAKEGIAKLGGDDFDYKIMEIAAAKLKENTGLDIFDLKTDQGIATARLREAQQKLKEAAQKAKQELSNAQTTQISLPNLIRDQSGNPQSLDLEVTRPQFNEAIHPLLMQSQEAIDKALTSAKLAKEDISRIILVGGSTRIPLVRELLQKIFDKEPYSDQDPDLAVVRGAAIFGASLGVPSEQLENTEEGLSEDQLKNKIVKYDIATHYLGIQTAGGRFSCLLEKGQEIPENEPLSVSKEYIMPRDDMTELSIFVYQSEHQEEFVRSDSVKCIGEFFLTGIPPRPRGEEIIRVTLELDQQNLLKVTATSSNGFNNLEIKRS